MRDISPLVSVGLPIYNRPEGLRRTLECFVNQTYANIEIVIADNCSPDPEVEKIAREYVAKDYRISYFRHEENKGWGYNTNFVIDKAKGDYFLRATDDDWWDVTFIEKIMKLFLNEVNVIAGMSNFLEVDMEGNQSKYHIKNHLPLLEKFTTKNKFKNLKNYICQYEGFGKAQIYGSIIKVDYLRTSTVQNLLNEEFLAGDLLINLFLLLRGNLVVVQDVLFKGTYNNERLYDTMIPISRKINLFFLLIDYGIIKDIMKKWHLYFYRQFKIVFSSPITLNIKIRLSALIAKRILLFYYDLICVGFSSRKYDVFKKLKRKKTLS